MDAAAAWRGRWSTVTSRYDTQPHPREGTVLDLIEDIESSGDLEQKDGHAIIGAVFKPGGKRCKADVEAVTMLIYDLDHGADATTPHAIADGLGVELLWYTTWSDGVKNDEGVIERRYRVVIPLKRPVTVEEHAALWVHIAGLIEEAAGCAPDRGCKDACRLNYTARAKNPAAVSEPDGDHYIPKGEQQ